MTPERAKEIAEAAYNEAKAEAENQLNRGVSLFTEEGKLRFALGYLRRAMQSALEEYGK